MGTKKVQISLRVNAEAMKKMRVLAEMGNVPLSKIVDATIDLGLRHLPAKWEEQLLDEMQARTDAERWAGSEGVTLQ